MSPPGRLATLRVRGRTWPATIPQTWRDPVVLRVWGDRGSFDDLLDLLVDQEPASFRMTWPWGSWARVGRIQTIRYRDDQPCVDVSVRFLNRDAT